ncbi:MAG: hypothetical protein HYU97_10545 [Deltaproteobacteria bacterium]|nr:hypothetical protein [Deltaproteobacteria bacterium]
MKKLGLYLFSLFFWISPNFSWALSNPIAIQHKSRMLWNQTIDYQLQIVVDASLAYDGESTLSHQQDKIQYHVMLNTAFLEKEAEELFARFAKINSIASEQLLPAPQDLLELEQALLEKRVSLSHRQNQVLRHLQESFEFLAWYKTYQQSWKGASISEQARAKFTQAFLASRIHSIEAHELGHLIDLKQRPIVQDFKKFSELNAYYTELFYGGNPYDTLAQALAGVRDEMRQKKSVDFSHEKVLVLLQWVANMDPHMMNAQDPLKKCCLVKLLNYKASNLAQLGKALYERG